MRTSFLISFYINGFAWIADDLFCGGVSYSLTVPLAHSCISTPLRQRNTRMNSTVSMQLLVRTRDQQPLRRNYSLHAEGKKQKATCGCHLWDFVRTAQME